MDITMSEGQKVLFSIHPNRRSDNRDGVFASPVVFAASISGDGSGIVVNVADDLRSAAIHGKMAGTTGTLSLSARKLNGDDVVETHTITVTPPAADDFGATVSEPVPDVDVVG